MFYQQISVKDNKLAFVKESYQEQITALELFFQDAFPKIVPKDVLKFGGGTALYFQLDEYLPLVNEALAFIMKILKSYI